MHLSAGVFSRVIAAALIGLSASVSTASAQQQPVIELAPPPESLPPSDGRGAPAESVPGVRVALRGIDKLSGGLQAFEGEVGQAVMFERLRIELRACYARTAARAPESSVFLQIYDTKYTPETLAFSGWMFASSPALSAMDHPRYDVWVLSCKTS